MKLSIIIPVHNEQATVAEVIKRVVAVELGGWEKEVIAVNDGSDDETKNILDSLVTKIHDGEFLSPNLLVIHHEKNMGKGAAVQSGLKKASGDYVLIQDADLEYDPQDIPKLLFFITDTERQFFYSSSNMDQRRGLAIFGKRGYHAYPERGFYYVIGAWILTTFYNLLFFQKLTDLYTGYKLMPTLILRSLNIQSTGFEFEAEVACKLARAGVKMIETPIHYRPRNKNQGKHIKLKDAFKGFWTIFKIWLE